MTAYAILLVPPERPVGSLLDYGVCGSRPPIVRRCQVCGRWHASSYLTHCEACSDEWSRLLQGRREYPYKAAEALPLMWDSKVVVAGCDLAARASDFAVQHRWSARSVNELAKWCVNEGCGVALILDVDRKETTP